MRPILFTCGLVTVMAFLPSAVSAQGNRANTGSTGMGASGGMSASSGFGSSGFGTAGSTGGFGTSGFGTAGGMSSGGMGSGGMGSGGMGAGGMGMGGQGMGMGGQGQQGFLGANNNQNQFLGRNTQNQGGAMGMNGMMNQLGGGNNRGQRGSTNLNTMNSLFGNNGNSSGMNTAPPIRPLQKVAFDYPVPKGEALQATVQSQMTQVGKRHPKLANVMLTANPGGEVVIRGVVKSEAEAKLAANLVRLEPGVRSVRNELTYAAESESKLGQ